MCEWSRWQLIYNATKFTKTKYVVCPLEQIWCPNWHDRLCDDESSSFLVPCAKTVIPPSYQTQQWPHSLAISVVSLEAKEKNWKFLVLQCFFSILCHISNQLCDSSLWKTDTLEQFYFVLYYQLHSGNKVPSQNSPSEWGFQLLSYKLTHCKSCPCDIASVRMWSSEKLLGGHKIHRMALTLPQSICPCRSSGGYEARDWPFACRVQPSASIFLDSRLTWCLSVMTS